MPIKLDQINYFMILCYPIKFEFIIINSFRVIGRGFYRPPYPPPLPSPQSQTITLDSGFLFYPIPRAQCCFAGWEKIERKVDIIGATLKEGKRGKIFF